MHNIFDFPIMLELKSSPFATGLLILFHVVDGGVEWL